MSFDVFLQAFQSREAAAGNGAAALDVLEPHIADRDDGFAHLVTSDGGADLYGIDDPSSGLTINHASGDTIWQIVVDAAVAGGFFIIPVGCPTAAVGGVDSAHLPAELGADVVPVTTGTELAALINKA